VPEMTLDSVAAAVNGHVDPGRPRLPLRHYLFDTRDLTEPNSLFFALRGETADGHDFLDRMAAFPHCAAVVAADWKGPAPVPVIRVADPLAAAQKLGSRVRATHASVRYAGITGSAGKTSTKEFMARLLSTRFRAYRSRGNWNNWIGMPFSLLNMPDETEAAVFELAMSDPGIGEIHRLARILRPHVAVILNAFPVHLEFLKTVDNVARAKLEIADFLSADDYLVINGDDPRLAAAVDGVKGEVVRFGHGEGVNDVVMKKAERQEEGTLLTISWWGAEVRFHTSLIHQVHLDNLFAAMVAAHMLGVTHREMEQVLDELEPVAGRGVIRRAGRFTIVDETYNSNPEAVKRVLAWVEKEFSSPRIAVLGDMLELGPREMDFHREVGAFWAGLDFDALIAVGSRARSIREAALDAGADPERVVSLPDALAAAEYLKRNFPDPCVLLLKASRGMALETIIKELSDG